MNTNNNETVTETELTTIDNDNIHNLIHTIRGLQVILDNDVAELYGYETKRINEAASNNKDRFPNNFRFKLTEEEYESIIIRSKISTLNISRRGKHKKYIPYAYTEQGIAMLSGMLKNKIAVQVSISIMNAFVEMRKTLSSYGDFFIQISRIDNKLTEHDKKLVSYDNKFEKVFDAIQSPDVPPQQLFFKDKHFDAYKFVVELVKTAKSSITVIDNYLDNSILDILSHARKNVNKLLITINKCKIDKSAIVTFEKQHDGISIIKSNEFHDRFIILDNTEIYAFGGSLKDLGAKTTTVNKLKDPKICSELILRIENIAKSSNNLQPK
jgi:hypothetical protein